jgi:D-alanyl-D-alanine dipeptidase
MWKIVSNPQYVADQLKVPYIIEEAVDITLVDTYGNELDMGTLLILGLEAMWLC